MLLKYSCLSTFNDCYRELMPYSVLAFSYWVTFQDAYQCQGHTHKWYRLQLPYNSCRTCLANHMVYIMPLVINSLGVDTNTRTNKHTYRHPHKNNFKKPGVSQLHALKSGGGGTALLAPTFHAYSMCVSSIEHMNFGNLLCMLRSTILICYLFRWSSKAITGKQNYWSGYC